MSKFQEKQIEQLNAELEFSVDAFSDSTDKWLGMYSSLQADCDEWKRRALEAEEAGQFLLDRLSEFELSDDADEMTTEYLGHVSPAEERLRIVLNSINSGKKETA